MSSAGNLLKEKRKAMNLSIDDIASRTRIQKKYIEAIEEDNFSFFSGQSFYQQVFIGSYADVVGLNKNDLLEQLFQDKNEYNSVEKSNPEKNQSNIKVENNEEIVVNANEPDNNAPVFEKIIDENEELPNDELEEEVLYSSEEVLEVEDFKDENEEVAKDELEEVLYSSEEILEVEDFQEESEEPIEENNLFSEPSIDTNEIIQENELDGISLDDIFAQLSNNSNEELNIEDNEVEEVKEETKSIYPIPKIYDKILQDVDVDTLMQPKEVENDYLLSEDTLESNIDDLNKLIEQLSSEIDNDLSKDTDSLFDEEISSELLNSSILEDIQKISSEVSIDTNFDQNLIDTDNYNPQNLVSEDKEPILESTAVIDITSGIELEKIPSERSNVELDEEEMNLDDLFVPVIEEDVDISEKLIKELEVTMENKELFNNLKEEIETEKTSMDLKVAKALGEAKENVDSEISEETKRFSALDYILIIVFIILVISLGYIAFQYLT